MRNVIRTILAAAALSVSGFCQAGHAMAADRDFEVVNTNTTHSIQQIWTAEAGNPDDPWTAADFSSPVAPGTTRDFGIGGSLCFLDVKVQFNDGVTQVVHNVDVCRPDAKVIGS